MRLEAVLVQVVGRLLARAEDEVPFEKGVLAKPAGELGVCHPRAAARTRRAIGRSRSPSGDPGTNEIIEPSAK